MLMIRVREYVDAEGRSRYARWFGRLPAPAAAKVSTALYRIELGNLSSVRNLGGGIFESRINFGTGYRVYFGKDGNSLIILLGGGTKKGQQSDIEAARRLWRDYKQQKKQEH